MFSSSRRNLVVLASAGMLFGTLLGCDPSTDPGGAGGGAGGAGGGTPDCVPSAEAYETNAKPIIEAKCATCHADVPLYGAPFSLKNYDDLIAGPEGGRLVDSMVTALADGAMPPPGADLLTHPEFDTLIGWASCGEQHPDFAEGLKASRPVLPVDANPPVGSTPIELRAPGFDVTPTMLDHYQNFYFDNLVTEDKFIQRIEVYVDDSRVLHHVTLHYDNPNDHTYLYAWAPGGGPVAFPDGGMRVKPTDKFRVEIHYNNGAGIQGVKDTSGVTFYVSDAVGEEYVMLAPVTWNILVPAGEKRTSTIDCPVTQEITLYSGMPHMHEIGSTFRTQLERADGTVEEVVALSGWSFELQRFYDYDGIVAKPGDTIHIECTYDNYKDTTVFAGLGTASEMCYDFMYVKPASAKGMCSGL